MSEVSPINQIDKILIMTNAKIINKIRNVFFYSHFLIFRYLAQFKRKNVLANLAVFFQAPEYIKFVTDCNSS
jgi:hypothetical protein